MEIPAQTVAVAARPRARMSAYVSLMKPHVTVLLLGMTLASMAVASGGALPLWRTLATLLGGALAAGSASAINCYWDRDIDELMSRTKTRALPAQKIDPVYALVFGLITGVISVVVLVAFVNVLSAALAASAIVFYVCIYTMWLKRSTTQNIVIGGAAGAVPVLVGWAAITGRIELPALIMFAVIFLWTPPHFWALSLVLKGDYARAGIPMLPVVHGDEETRKQIVIYSVILVLSTLSLVAIHAMGTLYLVLALVFGAGLLWYAIRLYRTKTLAHARAMFWFSNNYLALVFAAMVVDRLLR